MNQSKRVALLLLLFMSSSCATSNRNKTLMLTAGAGTVGAVYGVTRSEAKKENAMFHAATFGLTAAVAGLFLFDQEKENEDLKREKRELEEKNALLSKGNPELISEGSNLLSAPLPKDVSNLVRPGSWRRYKMDQWVQDESNPNVWYRQKEMFEIIPPSNSN